MNVEKRHPKKKADFIYEDLRLQIANGVLSVGDRLPTEKELAVHYRVAVLTLRKALKRLRKEGQIVNQRYHGTHVADPARNKMIGIILPADSEQPLFHPVFSRFVNGIEGVLPERGYGIEFAISNPSSAMQEAALHAKIGGTLVQTWVIPSFISPATRAAFRGSPASKILLHRPDDSLTGHFIEGDPKGLSMTVLEHLQAEGYRRIWVLAPAAMDFFRHAFLHFSQSPFVSSLMTICALETPDFSFASTQAICTDILKKNEVDAFVCADDEMATGALAAISALGLSAPQIGVVGGGDFPLSLFTRPPLTTVSYPYYQIGREVARLAVELAEGGSVEPMHRRFPPRLIKRQSTERNRILSQLVKNM
jgi:LacI family transcriptional regulator